MGCDLLAAARPQSIGGVVGQAHLSGSSTCYYLARTLVETSLSV